MCLLWNRKEKRDDQIKKNSQFLTINRNEKFFKKVAKGYEGRRHRILPITLWGLCRVSWLPSLNVSTRKMIKMENMWLHTPGSRYDHLQHLFLNVKLGEGCPSGNEDISFYKIEDTTNTYKCRFRWYLTPGLSEFFSNGEERKEIWMDTKYYYNPGEAHW